MRGIGFRDLEDLGPQRFQELVAALVLADHPDAEQLAGADGGADVLLERDGAKAKAWQVKHFPRQIRWEHCRDSLDAVVESYDVAEVVFVFPRDMSKRAKQTFDATLRSRHPGVAVSYMSGSQVIARLRRLEDEPLLEEFFGPDPRDQAVAIARHLGSNGLRLTPGPEADPMTEDLTLAATAGGRDRYYRTDVSLTTGDAPSPSWAEPPLMLLVGKEKDRTLRVAVWPERPESGRAVVLSFPDDEAGRDARLEIRSQFARHGKATAPGGATVRLKDMPEAFRAIGHTDELWEPDLTVEQAHEVLLAGELDGRSISRSLALYPVPALDCPDADEVFEFGRIDRGLHLFLSFQRSGDRMRLRCALELEADASVSLADALEAARLLVAVDEGAATLSFGDLDPVELPATEDEQRWDEHRGTAWLFEKLILIRDALGVTFELDHTVTVAEADEIETIVDVLESGKGRYIVANVIRFLGPGELDEWREPSGPLVARIAATVEAFGKTVDLGVAEVNLPPPDSIEVLEPTDDGRDRVELRWNDGPGAPFKIVSGPGEEPPELGIWPADELPPVGPRD